MARILVVDDESSIRASLGAFLELAGHDVSLASDAYKASAALSAHDFDVVVCDIVLPGRGGLEFLQEANHENGDLQVILITGEPGVETASEAVRQGAFDYITKPVSREQIVSVVGAAADRKALLDRNRELEEINRQHRDKLELLVEERTEELRVSEARYRGLFRGIADPVFVFDQETKRFLDGNEAALKRYGYTISELRGMTPEDLHPLGESQSVIDNIKNASDRSPNEYTHRTKSGESFPVEIHTEEIEYDGRQAWISVVRDITRRNQAEVKRREAEEQLRESEIRLQSIFGSMSEGIALHELVLNTSDEPVDYRILEVNLAFESILGIPRSDAVGALASDLYGSRDAPFLETYAQVAATGEPITFEEFFPPLDRYFLISVFSPGKGQFATVFTDVTMQRRSEEALKRSLEETIQAIAWIIEKRDPYTAGHQRRVAQLSEAIGRALGLPKSQLDGMRAAATLHDIGKITVPADILSKPSALSKMEFDLLKGHAKTAYDVLQTIEFPWPVAEIVYQHHERMDGSGYPQGLEGDDILLEARIIGVADVVEAMSSHRPYRPALGLDAALVEIQTNRGSLFDEDVVDACLRLVNDGTFEFEAEDS